MEVSTSKHPLKKEGAFVTPPADRADIAGSAAEKQTWIYRRNDTGVYVREVTVDSGRGDGQEARILQISDIHFNAVNDDDLADEEVMYTAQRRWWNADGAAVAAAEKTMEHASDFDQTVLTGDTLDYLSMGAIELIKRHVFDVDPTVIVTLGGHDTTRQMETGIPDKTSLESRLEVLQKAWNTDLFYVSRVIKGRVMVIAMDNGQGYYWTSQKEKLEADLQRARQQNLVVLLFQHEHLCTRNPAEKKHLPIRRNDTSEYDFYTRGIGGEGADEVTRGIYDLIVSHADSIKGVFCGHLHSDYYTEILATYTDSNGNTRDAVIPQYILTAAVYDEYAGHVLEITVR